MSGTGQHTPPGSQERVGALLRRMTLASLGLDDLEGVDPGAKDVLSRAERFAHRIDEGVQRLEGGARLRVLLGTPEFLSDVQERYVPLAVDPEFGPDFGLDGPRTPTDLGPWRKLLDAVLLVLFDEDEEGDFVSFAPEVRRQQIAQAVAQMAREQRLPAVARPAQPLAAARRAPPGVPQPASRTDYLSLSEDARTSIFDPQQLTSLLARSMARVADAGESSISGIQHRDAAAAELAARVRRLATQQHRPGASAQRTTALGSRLAARLGGRASTPLSRRSSEVGVGLLGSARSMRPFTAADLDAPRASSWLQALSGTGEGGAGEGDDVHAFDPRVSGVGLGSLADLVGSQREGYRYDAAAPGSLLALVPEYSESAIAEAFVSAAPASSLFARDPEALSVRPVMAALGRPDPAFVTAYPARMGRAGMQPVGTLASWSAAGVDRSAASVGDLSTSGLAPMRGPAGAAPSAFAQTRTFFAQTRTFDASVDPRHAAGHDANLGTYAAGAAASAAAQRNSGRSRRAAARAQSANASHERAGTVRAPVPQGLSMAAAVRQRLLGFVQHPSFSGALLQRLADEPTARLASLVASLGGGERTRLERHLEQLTAPRLPSTLGFSVEDLLAPLGTALARAIVSSQVGGATGSGYGALLAAHGELLRGDRELLTAQQARALASTLVEQQLAASAPAMSLLDRTSRQLQQPGPQRAERLLGAVLSGLPPAQASRAERRRADAAPSTPPGPLVLGDLTIDPSYLPALAEGLRAAHAAGRSARINAARAGATERSGSLDEGTFARLDRMLGLVRTGDASTSEARRLVDELKRTGVLPQQSRLVWEGATPMLVLPERAATPLTAMREAGVTPLSAMREAGVTPQSLASASPGATFFAADEVAPAGAQRRGPPSLTSASDLTRMFPLQRAAEILLPAVVDRADRQAASMLSEAIAQNATVRGAADRRDAAGRGAVAPQEHAGRHRAATDAETEGAPGRGFMVRQGYGPGSDMLSLSLTAPRIEQLRESLALRSEIGTSHHPGRLDHGGSETPRVHAHIDAMARPTAGAAGRRAEAMLPHVLATTRFEDRVAAELETRSALGGLRPQEAPRTLQLLAEASDAVKLTYSPQVLSRLAAAQSRAGDASSATVPVKELRAAMQEALARPGATPASIAREMEQRIGGLQMSQLAEGGSDAGTVGQRVTQAVRAVDRAVDRFAATLAAAGPDRPGYFSTVVPTGFESNAPSQVLARAFADAGGRLDPLRLLSEPSAVGAGAAGFARVPRLASSIGAAPGVMLQLRQAGAAAAGAEPGRVESSPGAVPAGVSTFDVVRPSTLSRMLSRFAPDRESRRSTLASGDAQGAFVKRATAEASTTAGFSSLRGEPGQLSGVLEQFVPLGSTPRRPQLSALPGAAASERTVVKPVVAPPTPGSVAHALEALYASSNGSPLGGAGEALASRLAEQGEPLRHVSPVGLTPEAVGELFGLGGGAQAERMGTRHESDDMVRRIEGVLNRARQMTLRPPVLSSPEVLAALVRAGVKPDTQAEEGLPAWQRAGEHVQGVELQELRDMLRQVGAMPVQGDKVALERKLVNPYLGQKGSEAGPTPLFKGEPTGAETKPASEVQNQEQAFAATDAGVPPWEELALIADEVYNVIMMKLRDEIYRRRSD